MRDTKAIASEMGGLLSGDKKERDAARLRFWVGALARVHPGYGYRQVTSWIRVVHGYPAAESMVRRIRRELGLRGRPGMDGDLERRWGKAIAERRKTGRW